jgi:hypothetical protein
VSNRLREGNPGGDGTTSLGAARGPIEINPGTRDIVHNEYIRSVWRVNGLLSNVEFETHPS